VTVTFREWDGNFSKSDGLLTNVTVQEKNLTDKEKSDGKKNQPAGRPKKLRNRKKNLTVQEKIWRSDISPWRPKYFTLTDYFKILTGHPFQTDSPRPDQKKNYVTNKWAWTIHRESNFIRSLRITQKFQTPQNDLREQTNNLLEADFLETTSNQFDERINVPKWPISKKVLKIQRLDFEIEMSARAFSFEKIGFQQRLTNDS